MGQPSGEAVGSVWQTTRKFKERGLYNKDIESGQFSEVKQRFSTHFPFKILKDLCLMYLTSESSLFQNKGKVGLPYKSDNGFKIIGYGQRVVENHMPTFI